MHQRKPAQRRHHDRQRGEQPVGEQDRACDAPDRRNTAMGEPLEKRGAEGGANCSAAEMVHDPGVRETGQDQRGLQCQIRVRPEHVIRIVDAGLILHGHAPASPVAGSNAAPSRRIPVLVELDTISQDKNELDSG